MLSVVLYGRNDSHGYNLHKRGAISLNAIAHLLRDQDDELIFVDYNTPDDLPTFPEAIADTLTEQAKSKLRILRLRPAQHARYAAQTHLMALEPIARNVAVRRSNPANRWVLSTNTDMIFVPRDPRASLGDLVGGLPEGFYHLPRFELPEALWESLDRREAEAIIASAGRWGERFHLDEVVRSAHDNLFDGPGDFQLFLRDDLFAIGGFDEAMLKGWHVDANIARRMRLLRSKVTSAEPLLRGYHCDHTRQASPYHKGDRVENDSVRFVDAVDRPEIATQIDRFGLAGETIEEVRLGSGSTVRYLAGLEAAVPHGLRAPLESAYVADAFGQLAYPVGHVLPYLLDLVSCIPTGARIGYLGARRDTYAAFAEGWRAMGGAHSPCIPAEAGWLTPGDLPLADWAQDVDVFVFEVGAEQAQAQADLSPEERARLWLVNQGLAAAFRADAVRQERGAPARRAIVVNAIHNSFEAQLFRHLSVTLTPYSSRIRHGFIVDPRRPPPGPRAWREAATALGRVMPVGAQEAAACAALATAGLAPDAQPSLEARALAGPIAALAEARAPGFPSRNDPGLRRLLDRLAERPGPAAFPAGVSPSAGVGAANRLARPEDWSEPAFVAMAYALFPNRRHDDSAERAPWTWERVVLALNLDAAQPLASRPHVLVAAELPELLAFMLSNLGARVDIADPRALAEGRLASVDFRDDLVRNTFAVPASAEPLGTIEARAADLFGGWRYDAVLLPQNGLFARGRDAAARLLRQAGALLKPGGHLGMAVLSLVTDVEPLFFGDNIALDLLRDGRLLALLADGAGLEPQGGVDARLTPGALDTLAGPGDARPCAIPALVWRDGPAVRVPAVFALCKSGEGRDDGWEAVDRALRTGALDGGGAPAVGEAEALEPAELRRLQALAAEATWAGAPGSVLRRLAVGEGVSQTPRAVHISAAAPRGLALFGAIGLLAPGPYELRIQGRAGAGGSGRGLVVSRDGVIASEPVLDEAGGGEWVVTFDAPGPLSTSIAIGLSQTGGAESEILDVVLR